MDSLFYWIAKVVWLLISPDVLLVVLVAVGWWLLRRGKAALANVVLGTALLAMVGIALFPVGEWVLYPLESRFATNPALPAEIDGVIALGGAGSEGRRSQWHQPELDEAAERYFAFIALARRFPDARLVFSGGTGSLPGSGQPETELAKNLLAQQGIDVARVIFEAESRNTYENAVLGRKLINPQPGEVWVLITSSWHMPRAVGVFCRAGWPVLPYPVDHETNPDHLLRIDLDFAGNLRQLKKGVKEWVGLLAYYVTGNTDSLVPKEC